MTPVIRPAFAGLLVAGIAVGSAEAQEPHKWRHGILEAKADAGLYEMVKYGGFDHKHGLDVDIVGFKGDGIGVRAVLSGDLDSFEGNPGGAMIATSHGADLKIIGCSWPETPLSLLAGPKVKTPEDLRGKTVAISTSGGSPALLLGMVLERFAIPPAEVRLVNLGSDNDRYRGLAAGVVDATVVSSEFELLGRAQGIRMLLSGHEIGPKFVRTCLETSGPDLERRRDDAVRFVAAEIDAVRYAVAHREETIALTKRLTDAKEDDPRAAFIFDYAVKSHAVDPDMAIPVANLQWTQDLLLKTANMDRPADIVRMVAEDVHQAALARARK